MKILTYPCKLTTPTAVALGRFDGVHLAHKAVISAASQISPPLTPAVFTFCDNPNKSNPYLLTTQEEKQKFIAECGTQLLVNATFDSVRDMSAEEFVDRVLCTDLNAKAVFCGYNYRFGKGASADSRTLAKLCKERNIDFTCIDEVEGFSSTAARTLLSEGKAKDAAEILGRYYTLKGTIIHGNALGRTIDTPTLNIDVPKEKLLPLFGVYATIATIDGKAYKSVTNIGLKPTVGSENPTVETYLLDAKGDFYGEEATLELVDFIRAEQKFSSLEALGEIIKNDVETARRILESL